MVNPPAARTSTLRRPSPAGAPPARLRAGARAAHGILALAFLLALVSGGRWPWLHVPAGITAGVVAWAGLFGWAAGAFAGADPAASGRSAGSPTRWHWGYAGLSGDAAALLVCLAGLSASGLGRWVAGAGVAASGPGHAADAWALAHEAFRLAALGMLAVHLLRVIRAATRHADKPSHPSGAARAETPPDTREVAE